MKGLCVWEISLADKRRPNMDFSARVLFANGVPAKGVQVRIYDKDAPEKGDDDLTIAAGTSDDEGRFIVRYEPSRYLDFTEIEMPAPFAGLPVDLSPGQRTRLIPDLTDIYRPYLEFRYTHLERSRRHTAWLVPFVTEFRLPDVYAPAEPFRPSSHGFRFVNSFSGYPLPISVPSIPELPFIPDTYGLCGGMSSAACDLYLAEREVPDRREAPSKRTSLHRYLYRRQLDTFGALGGYVAKFYAWMGLPDGTVYGTQKGSHDEFERIRVLLDDRLPVVLGLVYVSLAESLKMWENHQVLAYGYQETAPNKVRIDVYDPNYPQEDDIYIEAERVSVDSRTVPDQPPRRITVYGLRCVQKLPDASERPVRGLFMMPYVPVRPPSRL
jgi:hypothetical protein